MVLFSLFTSLRINTLVVNYNFFYSLSSVFPPPVCYVTEPASYDGNTVPLIYSV